jgi:hypothetical protein
MRVCRKRGNSELSSIPNDSESGLELQVCRFGVDGVPSEFGTPGRESSRGTLSDVRLPVANSGPLRAGGVLYTVLYGFPKTRNAVQLPGS